MKVLEKKVLAFMKEQAKLENFKLRLDDHYMAQYKGKDLSSGYFDYPESNPKLKKPLLAVGVKNRPIREWVETLLHEYCHFKQYTENCNAWKNYINSYKNKTNKAKTIHKAVMRLEADCEKRTIKLIQKLNLEKYINIKEYAQRANSYLTFYHIYSKTQKWYEIAPFSVKAIVSKMPKKIGSPTSLKPNSELIGLYIRYCYKDEYAKGE